MAQPIRFVEAPLSENPLWTIGVLADTHIPDRRRTLQPAILEYFQNAGVNLILHAGDICLPSVLEELNEIAPVTAVQGNRDWFFRGKLPAQATLELAGVTIGLAHGHGGLVHYLVDKLQYFLIGYRYQRYYKPLVRWFPDAQVVVFGHTHTPESRFEDGRLVFNPGSSCCKDRNGNGPGIGLIKIFSDARVYAALIPIEA